MTTTTLPRRPHLVAREQAPIRAAIATYSKPFPADIAAHVVATDGQAALDRLMVDSATFLAEQRAALAVLVAEEAAARAYWNCTRCQGTGDYLAPTSHYRAGRPVCFTCKGSGRR